MRLFLKINITNKYQCWQKIKLQLLWRQQGIKTMLVYTLTVAGDIGNNSNIKLSIKLFRNIIIFHGCAVLSSRLRIKLNLDGC